jgi:hypothetical protein
MPREKSTVEDIIEDIVVIDSDQQELKEPVGGRQPRVYPVLPVRDQVYFPNMLFPLLV